MERGWLWLAAPALAACGFYATPAGWEPSEAEPRAGAGSTPSTPTPSTPTPRHDDPRACIDPPLAPSASEVEGNALVDRALAKLGACTAHLKESGYVRLTLTPSAAGKVTVTVNESSVHDCKAVECLQRGLERAALPHEEGGMGVLGKLVTLAPQKAPLRVEQVEGWPDSTSSCVDAAAANAVGRLPPELIQKRVREHSAAFGRCHEAAVAHDPKLAGRVSIRFVIGRDGNVASARVDDCTLPNCTVAACVRNEFKTITFPEPQGGVVTVVYPLMLKPD